MQTLMKFGIGVTKMIIKILINSFWKDVFQCWRTIIAVQKGDCERMFDEHIWYNPDIYSHINQTPHEVDDKKGQRGYQSIFPKATVTIKGTLFANRLQQKLQI